MLTEKVHILKKIQWGRTHVPPAPSRWQGWGFKVGWLMGREGESEGELKPKARHPAPFLQNGRAGRSRTRWFFLETSGILGPFLVGPGKHAWSWFPSAWHQLGERHASKVENVSDERTRLGVPHGSLPKPQCYCKGMLVNQSNLGVEEETSMSLSPDPNQEVQGHSREVAELAKGRSDCRAWTQQGSFQHVPVQGAMSSPKAEPPLHRST